MRQFGTLALAVGLAGCAAQGGITAATTAQAALNNFATTAATANVDLAGSVLGACITNLQTLKTQSAAHTTPAAP